MTAPLRWRARAFGLELELTFPVPGLPNSPGGSLDRRVAVDQVADDTIESDWRGTAPTRVADMVLPDGSVAMTIDQDARLGYLLSGGLFGRYDISPDGASVRCAPVPRPDWDWQRLLIARILPMVAALRGLEVLHASAVALGGRAVGFVGGSGAGKTSVAIHLVLRGAEFLADDVLALEASGDAVIAHSGAQIAAIRPEEESRIAASERRRLGVEVGRDHKTYMSLASRPGTFGLEALYYLEVSDTVEEIRFNRLTSPDPRLLLGSTFTPIFTSAGRLATQLDICARMARTVAVFRAVCPPDADAATLAAAIHRSVSGLVPSAHVPAHEFASC